MSITLIDGVSTIRIKMKENYKKDEREKERTRIIENQKNDILLDSIKDSESKRTQGGSCEECGSYNRCNKYETVYAYRNSVIPQYWCEDCGLVIEPSDVLFEKKMMEAVMREKFRSKNYERKTKRIC